MAFLPLSNSPAKMERKEGGRGGRGGWEGKEGWETGGRRRGRGKEKERGRNWHATSLSGIKSDSLRLVFIFKAGMHLQTNERLCCAPILNWLHCFYCTQHIDRLSMSKPDFIALSCMNLSLSLYGLSLLIHNMGTVI